MKKLEILQKLKEFSVEKDKYIIVGDSALVLHDIIEESDHILLSCSKDIYNHINWKEDISDSHVSIKSKDWFKIGYNFYDEEKVITLDGFQVQDLEACYDLKVLENKKSDKKIIQKLDLLLCQKDNQRYEKKKKQEGYKYIAGVDEVGRGPLVGPVVAACVILPDEFDLEGLTDSKKLSERKRNFYYEEIKKQAVSIGIGIIDNNKIDEVNIYEATKLAMKEAINNCNIKPDSVLIDAMPLDLDIPTTSIIKGDLKSITISAASVIAKVTRDKMMYELDKTYPMYDFKNNKGYPTKKHLEAIKKYGIIDEHRKSYDPVKKYLENK